ncbi:MAG TPA: M14 family zinc carboxypeptidase [Oscillospiraceae bacterium]|nr:M14 family zinc carboxypeptidase [Oscillospiraceae bacterium]
MRLLVKYLLYLFTSLILLIMLALPTTADSPQHEPPAAVPIETTVSPAMVRLGYAALRGHFTAFRSVAETERLLGSTTTALSQQQFYQILARTPNEQLTAAPREYFLGIEGEILPLEAWAQLGIVEVPGTRLFKAAEQVSWQAAQQDLARAVFPQLRLQNEPAVVSPQQVYSYQQLEEDLQRLVTSYPELLKLQVIGESVEGRAIYALRLGEGEEEIILDAAIHASEWLTAPLVMKLAEEYAHHAHYQTDFASHDVAALLKEVSFWFIPMVNPDGLNLVQAGPQAITNGALVEQMLAASEEIESFKAWKANIRGVDLNRQFPISWEVLENVQEEPAPSHFKGFTPLSEPEARALSEFALARQPLLTLSFHQQGEWLFWYHKQKGAQFDRDQRLAAALAALTGYRYQYYDDNGGKYMDFVIQELGVPAITVEVGTVVGDLQQWPRIWQQVRTLPLVAAKLRLQDQ